MNLMIIKRGRKGSMETIATFSEPTHIPRERETILYNNKEYTVLQVLWEYNERYIFVYCKEN